MARRLTGHLPKDRDKIRASQLINRLFAHAFGQLKKPMDPTQIRAAEVVLKKIRPDLATIEHTGEVSIANAATDALRALNGSTGPADGVPEAGAGVEAEPGDVRH